jgi:HAD superfamily hydrolase (TIGR01450 family)
MNFSIPPGSGQISHFKYSKPDRLFPGYIFDLDGTIWMTGTLIEGAALTVSELRRLGSRILFLTNNSDGTREMFADQLTEAGIPADTSEIISTSYVMAKYLKDRSPGARCFVIGPDPVREELTREGLVLRDRPGEIDYVVVGIDRDFTYKKLQIAFEAIRAGARFAATNPDPYSPSSKGDLADIGSLIAAIEVATDHKLDILVGKPNHIIITLALTTLGLSKGECLLVGDQLNTDVEAGHASNVPVALFLRDPKVIRELPKYPKQPDYVVDRLSELLFREKTI